MTTREFTIEELEELEITDNGDCVVSDELHETRRWSITHRVIFEQYGKLWEVFYDEPATEMQDIDPWEWGPVEAHEVEPVTKTVTEYKRKAA